MWGPGTRGVRPHSEVIPRHGLLEKSVSMWVLKTMQPQILNFWFALLCSVCTESNGVHNHSGLYPPPSCSSGERDYGTWRRAQGINPSVRCENSNNAALCQGNATSDDCRHTPTHLHEHPHTYTYSLKVPTRVSDARTRAMQLLPDSDISPEEAAERETIRREIQQKMALMRGQMNKNNATKKDHAAAPSPPPAVKSPQRPSPPLNSSAQQVFS